MLNYSYQPQTNVTELKAGGQCPPTVYQGFVDPKMLNERAIDVKFNVTLIKAGGQCPPYGISKILQISQCLFQCHSC